MEKKMKIVDACLNRNKILKEKVNKTTCLCGKPVVPFKQIEIDFDYGTLTNEFPVGVICEDCECGRPGTQIHSRRGNK